MLISSMRNIRWAIGIHINKTRRDNLLYYYYHLLLLILFFFFFFFFRYKLVLITFDFFYVK